MQSPDGGAGPSRVANFGEIENGHNHYCPGRGALNMMRSVGRRHIITIAATAAGLIVATTASSATAHSSPARPKPTVVLLHGAWADSSSWDGVVSRLQHDGYPVDVSRPHYAA